jgi:16S rRNA (adenine1518-N6/adenine1519-N6)-dimethyltransferase
MPTDRPPSGSNDQGRHAFRDRGLRAKRAFGQCFLADANVARNIAAEATTPAGGTCLEIGPGTGALTRHLLARAARVVAIERDRDLVPLLQDTFAVDVAAARLEVVEGDAANSPWIELIADGPAPRSIVGNVPYNITGRLLERAIHLAPSVERVVFMVQKEVADRVGAAVGGKEYGALSVFAQQAFCLRKRMFVPASCFRPRPDVDSTVIVLEPRSKQEPVGPLFYELVTAAVGRRRKTLRNAWKGWRNLDAGALAELAHGAGVSLDDRAERIEPGAYVKLSRLAAERLAG